MPANVETMFSVRQVPWHGLGQIVDEALDSVAAIKAAGLDWEVMQKEIFQSGGVVGIQDYEKIDNFKANVRSDNGKVLGIVTDRYQIVQNHEAFTFTDELLKEGEVRYETAGSLAEGKKIWLLAKMNQEYDVLGDRVDPYLCFTMAHDGTGSIRTMITPVRVVCQNTLNLAIRQSDRAWSTRHVGDIASKMVQAKQTLGLAHTYMEKLNEEANVLSEIFIPDTKFNEILHALIPINEKMNERAVNTAEWKRSAIRQAMRADDIAKFRNTGWQIINAVSDFVGHTEPARRTQTFSENRFASVVNGDALLDKTYVLLKQAA